MTKTAKGYSLRHRAASGDHPARWVAALPPPDGKRRWQEKVAPPEIRTKGDANRWLRGLLEERAAHPPIVKRSPSAGPTVRELYEPWVRLVHQRPDLERATKAGYVSAFETQILPMIGDDSLAGCDVAFLAEWVRRLRERPAKVPMRGKPAKDAAQPRSISPSRVANVVSAFSMFLSDQIAAKKVTFPVNPALDPAVRREIPLRPRAVRVRLLGERPGVPTIEDAQAVLDCSDAATAVRVRAVIVFTTGERDGEIAGLRVGRLRLDGAVPAYEIVEAVQIYGPTGHATPGKLKTESSERALPMHPAARAAIVEWLTIHWPRLYGREPRPDDFLFPSSEGKGYRPKSADLLRTALRKAGRPTSRGGKQVTFHRARHAFAIELARLGVPREIRQVLLGHAADGADEAHYTEHGIATLAEHIARIPLRWPSIRPDVRPEIRPAAEQDSENANDSGSHLRDLNSRPTVYETAVCSAAGVRDATCIRR